VKTVREVVGLFFCCIGFVAILLMLMLIAYRDGQIDAQRGVIKCPISATTRSGGI